MNKKSIIMYCLLFHILITNKSIAENKTIIINNETLYSEKLLKKEANKALNLGNFTRAKLLFEKLLKKFPNDPVIKDKFIFCDLMSYKSRYFEENKQNLTKNIPYNTNIDINAPDSLKNPDMINRLFFNISFNEKEINEFNYFILNIDKFKNLEELELNIYDKNIKIIPKEIYSLNNLKKLIIRKGSEIKLPSGINKLANLEFLECNFNIEEINIPEEIFSLNKLEKLIIHADNLNKISSSIIKLTELKSLEFKTLKQLDIPKEIIFLTKLNDLTLSASKMSDLPDGIFRLKNLKELKLSSSNLEFSDKILQLGSLSKLSLTSYGNFNVSYKIGYCKTIRELEISSSNSELFLPISLGSMENITSLSLEGKLNKLSFDIEKLKNLQSLKLIKNPIYNLNNELKKVTKNLKELTLSEDKLISIPKEITRLNLEKLDLSKNNININDNDYLYFTKLNKLRELDLSSNEISFFKPDIVSQLGELEKFSINSNVLTLNNRNDIKNKFFNINNTLSDDELGNLRDLSETQNGKTLNI